MQARDSWSVIGGRFGTVASGGIVFDAKKMYVINSTINHMSSKVGVCVLGCGSGTSFLFLVLLDPFSLFLSITDNAFSLQTGPHNPERKGNLC